MTAGFLYRVAVPSPLRRLFDYLPPEDAGEEPLQPGCRVLVPFGQRRLVGLVVASAPVEDRAVARLRPVAAVLDDRPLMPAALFQVCLWAADYYQHPPGEALMSALPVLLRKGEPPATPAEYWQLSVHGRGLAENALARAPRQQELLGLLRQGPLAREAIRAAGIDSAILRALRDKKLIEPRTQAQEGNDKPVEPPAGSLKESPLTLYPGQQDVLDAIELHGYGAYLLQGETGSGKTEVYLQVIEKILRYGRQALVLIPEISLTPQTLGRFRRRFQCRIAVLHSGLSQRQRLEAWQAARTGKAGIVIGTRSAVFTPLSAPGAIIVDEEHDASYKQQEGFRYSARDVAVMRAHRERIPVILGSATPALETLNNADRGRYRHLRLDRRPDGTGQPRWQLVDIRHLPMTTGLSAPLIESIGEELKAGNQVLVFLNRRGYAPVLMCHDCGWTALCPRCDRRMTSHRAENRLRCHHCEYAAAIPVRCPECRSPSLQFLGQGTERGEALLSSLFPDTRVLRIDRDTTRRKDAMTDMVAEVGTGEPCILVGTQILAKGHHFPDVTLVAILDIDAGLFSSDFRATERLGQTIIQVAGRAGRGHKAGRVLLQSHHCDHPLIDRLTAEGYDSFARSLLAERALNGMPPFRNLALLRGEHGNAADAEGLLARARELAEAQHPPSTGIQYLGPLPSPLEKKAGRYRYQLSIICDSRPLLQRLLRDLCTTLEGDKLARQVRWSVDVDPIDTL